MTCLGVIYREMIHGVVMPRTLKNVWFLKRFDRRRGVWPLMKFWEFGRTLSSSAKQDNFTGWKVDCPFFKLILWKNNYKTTSLFSLKVRKVKFFQRSCMHIYTQTCGRYMPPPPEANRVHVMVIHLLTVLIRHFCPVATIVILCHIFEIHTQRVCCASTFCKKKIVKLKGRRLCIHSRL